MKYLKIITTTILLITLAALSSKNAQAQAVKFEYDAAGNMIKRMADVVCYADHIIEANESNNEKLDRLTTSSGKIETKSRKPTFGPVDVLVRKNEMVEFRAEHIELKPGFSVETDASFNALIEPCEQ